MKNNVYSMNKIDFTKNQFKDADFKRFEYNILWKKDYIKKLTFLSGLVPNLIEKIFANSNFKWNGEYNNDIWIIEYKNSLFAIISSKGRGTTLETLTTDENLMFEFIDELIKHFINLNDPKIEMLKIFLT